jgi:hypothetical protein
MPVAAITMARMRILKTPDQYLTIKPANSFCQKTLAKNKRNGQVFAGHHFWALFCSRVKVCLAIGGT